MIIGLVVLLLLCPCVGLVGWAVWRVADDASTSAGPSMSDPALPSGAPTNTAPSPDRDEFAKGDCLVNDGTDDDAQLRKVPCGPNTYEVLLRIPATTDGDRCEIMAPQATANYVHDNTVDVLDYVLCLRER
ncbi:hypothetical protein ACIBTV_16960 [Micromonospora sp. NPDC049366]|uniref:LppU/SCO3897 family protein n=1 Tax=Micromonospora sp. NPDC049366 TaxID=3364271 RepID=UPI00379A7394